MTATLIVALVVVLTASLLTAAAVRIDGAPRRRRQGRIRHAALVKAAGRRG